MTQHRTIRDRLTFPAIALLAAALIACGTASGKSAGRPAESAGEAPSEIRLTEFEHTAQKAAPHVTQPTGGTGAPSEASGAGDGPFLIP